MSDKGIDRKRSRGKKLVSPTVGEGELLKIPAVTELTNDHPVRKMVRFLQKTLEHYTQVLCVEEKG